MRSNAQAAATTRADSLSNSVYQGASCRFGRAIFRALRNLAGGNAMRFLLTAEVSGAAEAPRIGAGAGGCPRRSAARPGGGDRLPGRRPGAAWVQRTLANARAWHAEAKRAAAAHLRELPPTVLASQDAAEGCAASSSAAPDASPAAELAAAAACTARAAARCLDEPGAGAGAAACLPEEVERDLGGPIGLRIDVGFASHILKLAGPAGDHSDRWVGEHGRGVD